MSESKQSTKGTVRQAAIERARHRRADRIRAARERENAITETVIDIATNRAIAVDAEHAAARDIAKLRRMGESQRDIADLCEMTLTEVRAALALTGARAPRTATTGGLQGERVETALSADEGA
ncbi:hypothetical protein [Glycomyces sp. NPDC048151]|uniref:hypothetical protein n=1 Tax=Glycomyces sp. NPDC048151 TaxID=3364002 RepID=UPI003722341B